MKKFFYIAALFSFTLVSCGDNTEYNEQQGVAEGPDYDELLKKCQDIEKEILATQAPSDSLLKAGIKEFQAFAGAFPEDPESPNYLLKASDFSMNTGQIEKSVKILDRIIRDYPEFDKMEDVMYVKASHIDLNLRDTTWAKQAYQEFIDKYPESELVPDAQSRIENIALSIEELAEKFMKELEEQPN